MLNLALLRLFQVKKISAFTFKKPAVYSKRRFTSQKAKRMFSFSRWLHIYISSALFCLLLFFCITGITLNHLDWATHNTVKLTEIKLPNSLTTLSQNDEYPVKKIQQFVEKTLGVSNPRSIDLALDIDEITYDYPLPSGYAFVTIMLKDQIMEVESVHGGVLAILNDLHKGRHSGNAWSWVIDISAILIVLFTITGIIILLQNSKHRRQALITLLLGSLTPVVIYIFAVPHLTL